MPAVTLASALAANLDVTAPCNACPRHEDLDLPALIQALGPGYEVPDLPAGAQVSGAGPEDRGPRVAQGRAPAAGNLAAFAYAAASQTGRTTHEMARCSGWNSGPSPARAARPAGGLIDDRQLLLGPTAAVCVRSTCTKNGDRPDRVRGVVARSRPSGADWKSASLWSARNHRATGQAGAALSDPAKQPLINRPGRFLICTRPCPEGRAAPPSAGSG